MTEQMIYQTAAQIAALSPAEPQYRNAEFCNIWCAAWALLRAGWERCQYRKQYKNGKTAWTMRGENGTYRFTVTRDGAISYR